MASRLLFKKTKPGRNGRGRRDRRAKVGAHVVGPARDPAAEFARMDEEGQKEYQGWLNIRDGLVEIGKRLGTIKAETRDVLHAPSTTLDEESEARYGARSDIVDDIVTPPFDLETLCLIGENSSSLIPNIEAYKTNIDGFGHRFEPVLQWDSPEINNEVQTLMITEALDDQERPDLMDLTSEDFDRVTPSLQDVEAKRDLWKRIATIEKGRVKTYFDQLNPLEPFTEIREEMRYTKELLGNAGWEVIREDPNDPASKVTQVYNVPFVNVRLIRADREPRTTKVTIRRDPIRFEEVEVERYFRRYVRIVGARRIYYKDFGDPRVVSRSTGQYFDSVDKLREQEGKDVLPANELMHWRIKSPVTPYGIPRWIGSALAVMGSRASEEVNFLYFDNKAIPPMVLLVSGGRVSEEAILKLESYFQDRIKGRENFHKIMVIEALPADVDVSEGDLEHSGKLRLELRPLMQEIQQDALFQNYDANNILKVGRSFRQPPILTGDTRDQNRATAEIAKAFAEEQIYQPERTKFDDAMDRFFLVPLKIHFWRFRTNAPVQRIPNDLVDNATKSLERGALTPNETRKLLEDAFSFDFGYRPEEWANVPPRLAQAAARQGSMVSAEVHGDERSRAAEQVESTDGDLLARGRTRESEDHFHSFVVLRDEGEVKVVLFPAGEDGHVHRVPDDLALQEGKEVEAEVEEASGHSHSIKFMFPFSKKRSRRRGILGAVASLRRALQEEIADELQDGLDDFFDPARDHPPRGRE